MAGREHFHDSIFRKDPETGLAEPLENVAVSLDKILENGTVDPITPIPYSGRKVNEAAEPMHTDENGEIDFWLDPGDYNITFSDPLARISDQTVGFSSTPGAPNGMLRSQLPEYGRGLFDAGDIKLSGRQGDHPGWLLCDGRTLTADIYPALFEAIGYVYGGSGPTFSLPDLRDAVPIGPGNMGTARGDISVITADTSLGKKVGSPTTTFNEDFLPSHTHPHSIGVAVSMDAVANHNHGGATGSMNRSNPHGHGVHPSALPMQFIHSGGVDFGFPYKVRKVTDSENLPHFWFRSIGGTGQTDINHEHAIGLAGGHAHTLHSSVSGAIAAATAGAAAKTVDILQPAVSVNFFMKI